MADRALTVRQVTIGNPVRQAPERIRVGRVRGGEEGGEPLAGLEECHPIGRPTANGLVHDGRGSRKITASASHGDFPGGIDYDTVVRGYSVMIPKKRGVGVLISKGAVLRPVLRAETASKHFIIVQIVGPSPEAVKAYLSHPPASFQGDRIIVRGEIPP